MTDAVIVGAGIIGMLTARELMAAGLTVTLLERRQPAKESSWAGGGILSPLYPWRYPDAVSELARWSQRAYPGLCDALIQETGIDPELEISGLLTSGLDDMADAVRWAGRFDVQLESVSAERAMALEPQLGVALQDCVWMPGLGQVRNPRLTRALRASLDQSGADFRANSPALGWVMEAGRVRAVRTAGGDIEADAFVVASGAWTAGLLKDTGLSLPIQPVRGQMILFRGPPGLVHRITLHEGHYTIPRRDGRVLFGSTLEYTGFEKHTTREAFEALSQSAFTLIPALKNLPIECHWAGLRPGSPDGVPVIGPHPELPNLYVCAGHFRNGVVLAPGSARLLADQLTGRQTEIDVTPYLPEVAAGKSTA